MKIDGTTVRNPKQYVERSPLFKVTLPRDNQLGLDPMLLSPSVDEGYYLFLEPLRAGTHSINWRATCGGYKQDVHYTLIVRRDLDD